MVEVRGEGPSPLLAAGAVPAAGPSLELAMARRTLARQLQPTRAPAAAAGLTIIQEAAPAAAA